VSLLASALPPFKDGHALFAFATRPEDWAEDITILVFGNDSLETVLQLSFTVIDAVRCVAFHVTRPPELQKLPAESEPQSR
jgi:hypothetical protein